jgi:hypothetical protein
MLQKLPKLEHLSVKGNQIVSLNSEFAFYGLNLSLKKLNLASNRIEFLSRRVFNHISKLRELNLEKNKLGMAPLISFDSLESELKTLNLENNGLKAEQIEATLSKLTNLETLRLGINDMSQLNTNLFIQFKNLSHLDMYETILNKMPYFTGLNSSLIHLNVAKNSICHVNAVNLRRMYPKLKNLNLNENPLRCDCNLLSLRHWMDEIALVNKAEEAPGMYVSSNFNWKCSGPEFNTQKYLFQVELSDLTCNSRDNSNNKCELDHDFYLPKTTVSTSITTTSTTTTTTVQTTTASIKILDENTQQQQQQKTSTLIQNLLFVKSSSNNNEEFETREAFNSQLDTQVSFFASNELKQTLIGSLIGALSVLLVVFVLISIIKITKNRFLKTQDDDLDTKDNDSKTAPYELGKLSLNTFCINSSGSSSSTSSSCSNSNNTTHTTANCLCSVIKPLNDTATTKIADPLKLLYYPQCMTNTATNNLHYMATNLPYSPNESQTNSTLSSSASPIPNTTTQNEQLRFYSQLLQNNSIDAMNMSTQSNTYDKLHQRPVQNGTATLIRVPILNQQQFLSQFNTLQVGNNQNNNPAAETTPFLIITDVNRFLLENSVQFNQQQQQLNQIDLQNSQHQYHEIGDALLFNNNNKQKLINNKSGELGSNENRKPSEMYI